MKTFPLLVIFLFVLDQLYCQETNVDWTPIERQVRRIHPNGNIYYSDSISAYTVNAIDEFDGKYSTLYAKCLKERGLEISKSEWKFIKAEFKKSFKIAHADNLFKNARVIKKDSILRFVDSLNSHIIDSFRTSPSILTTDPLNWVYSFSKPILFRNNSMVFYYFMYYRNSSGSHYFRIERSPYTAITDGCTIGIGDW